MTWWKLLIRKYDTIVNLSPLDRSVLIQALWLLPIVAILLQVKGLRFTQDLLLRLSPPPQSIDPPPGNEIVDPVATRLWTTVRMVKIAVRYHARWTNCLKQSLVLWILLRNQGIISEIRIGIQRDSDTFAAHAWVEYQGLILNDADDVHQRFQAFDRSVNAPVETRL